MKQGADEGDEASVHTFSILYRIEWVETRYRTIRCPTSWVLSVSCIGSNGLKLGEQPAWNYNLPLSVSCIGSNGLKRGDEVVLRVDADAFSILYRIEWVETWNEMLEARDKRTFSILYRIEWVETRLKGVAATALNHFQYPVSDRMG